MIHPRSSLWERKSRTLLRSTEARSSDANLLGNSRINTAANGDRGTIDANDDWTPLRRGKNAMRPVVATFLFAVFASSTFVHAQTGAGSSGSVAGAAASGGAGTATGKHALEREHHQWDGRHTGSKYIQCAESRYHRKYPGRKSNQSGHRPGVIGCGEHPSGKQRGEQPQQYRRGRSKEVGTYQPSCVPDRVATLCGSRAAVSNSPREHDGERR